MQYTVLPAGARGFDTASRLTSTILDAAKAAGISFVVKYVPYGAVATSKMWTADEVALCQSRGLAVLAVWEVQGNRALGGATVGAVDGGQARGGMARLGYPLDLFISTAVDYDVWAPNSAATLAYVRAFASTCGGGEAAYGDEDVADGLIGDNPIITLPNAPAWSRVLRAAGTNQAARVAAARGIPDVRIYQYPSTVAYGIGVDPLLVLQPTRAWLITADPAPAPIPPSPTPVGPAPDAATLGGDDMGFIARNTDGQPGTDAGNARWFISGIAKRHLSSGDEVERFKRRGLIPASFNLADPNDPVLELMTTAELDTFPTV